MEALSSFWQTLDPVAQKIVLAAGAFVVLMILLGLWRRQRTAAAASHRRAELKREYENLKLQQEEVERLSTRIVATSSTSEIAGFEIQRQIETVMTDGHTTPMKSIEMLKALAAQKGGNAIINLVNERQAGAGKFYARGDVVMAKQKNLPPPRGPRPPGAA